MCVCMCMCACVYVCVCTSVCLQADLAGMQVKHHSEVHHNLPAPPAIHHSQVNHNLPAPPAPPCMPPYTPALAYSPACPHLLSSL